MLFFLSDSAVAQRLTKLILFARIHIICGETFFCLSTSLGAKSPTDSRKVRHKPPSTLPSPLDKGKCDTAPRPKIKVPDPRDQVRRPSSSP